MLTTKEVNTALGVVMTAPFIIEKLGVQPTEKVKNGYHWSAAAFSEICDKLAAHALKVKADTLPEEDCSDLFA